MSEIEVFHDGSCPLCRREIALMRGLDKDGKIRFTDISSADAVGPADRETLLARFHVVENGELKSGAEAFAAMWRTIPRLAPLGRFARRPVVLRALEAAYRLFLRARPILQRLIRRWDRARKPS
jgi:predicted DCC family thiol-disulfide oxidoreductase YuxK